MHEDVEGGNFRYEALPDIFIRDVTGYGLCIFPDYVRSFRLNIIYPINTWPPSSAIVCPER